MIQRIATFACASFWVALTFAQGSSGDNQTTALDNYTISGTAEQDTQVAEAIAASPAFAAQLHELAATQFFSGISIIESVATVPGKPAFAGFIDGSKIVLTRQLLLALRRSRLFDVVLPDDVLPNQTVFVLAHLAQHLRTADAMRTALKDKSGPDAYAKLRLRDEAIAFIDAWNVTLDAATHANKDVQLTSRQIASLLVNSRYRFALPFNGNGPKIKLDLSGNLELSVQNIEAVTQRLMISNMADIE